MSTTGLTVLLLWRLSLSEWLGRPLLHTYLQLVLILLACGAGILALIHFYYYDKRGFLLLLGLGLLGTALLDAHQLLVSLDEFNLKPELRLSQAAGHWQASRLHFGVMLLLSWLVCHYESRSLKPIHGLLWLSYPMMAGLTWLLFNADVGISDSGFAAMLMQPGELSILVLLGLSLLGYLYLTQKPDHRVVFWLSLSILANLISQLIMLLHPQGMTAGLGAAQLLIAVSYLLICCGLLLDMQHRFKQAHTGKLRQESIIASAPDGIVTLDELGIITACNSAAEQIFGYAAAELTGNNLTLLLPAGLPPAGQTQAKLDCEVEARHKDGSVFPLQLAMAETGDASAPGFTAIVKNISQRKARELQLVRTAERLTQATRAGAIGLWDYDLVQDALTWDEQMYSIYRLTREQYPDAHKAWLAAVHPHDLAEAQSMLAEAVTGTGYCISEYRIIWPDGAVRFIRAVGTVIYDEAARAERIVGVNWDITEHNQIMLALERARQEADAANAAKSAFLATMSHEIRTPMNGVISMAEILAHSPLLPQQSDLAQTIEQSAKTLLTLIDDILDFSKIEAGQLEIALMPTAVEDLVESLCDSLATVAAAKNVRLNLFISPQIPSRILVDDVRLRQILYNLLGNAIKFCANMPDRDSQVWVRVEVSAPPQLQLNFTVTDNGIGMRQQTLNKLFTPFSQADAATTRSFGGTGLGLAICKRLVHLLHGKIDVDSTLGQGSSFRVGLPFNLAAEQPREPLPNITELTCILLNSLDYESKDLCAYLEHAGAKVRLFADMDRATSAVTLLRGTVVIIHGQEYLPPLPVEPACTQAEVHYLFIGAATETGDGNGQGEIAAPKGQALRRRSLLNAVAKAAGRATVQPHKPKVRVPAEVPSKAAAQAQGRLILVAEDDEINRKVILQQFALLGYAGKVAANGLQALELWRQQQFSLVITDLHMPEMDGYALARAIRQEEPHGQHIPILALTANALRGEASRAMAAGMDSYLTKPLPLARLRTALEKWLPQTVTLAAVTLEPEPQSQPREAVLDVAVLQKLVGDDDDIVQGFLQDYYDALQQHMARLSAKPPAGMQELAFTAHRLKSSSRAVGALIMADNCEQLEQAAKRGSTQEVVTALRQLEENQLKLEAELLPRLNRQKEMTVHGYTHH
ncbi:ATP-binding protein [Shewanella sp. AS16]|uniref:ATP-binding protein n=1 Tax=Shewanella sp. AS16 TaxID=2907625 RepID=UPI001F3DA981|nr:ATP-binding protein [Shewanella sp. AS16]MCE9688079.1 ATP-binding protein [Shewanella sp. AS16]